MSASHIIAFLFLHVSQTKTSVKEYHMPHTLLLMRFMNLSYSDVQTSHEMGVEGIAE